LTNTRFKIDSNRRGLFFRKQKTEGSVLRYLRGRPRRKIAYCGGRQVWILYPWDFVVFTRYVYICVRASRSRGSRRYYYALLSRGKGERDGERVDRFEHRPTRLYGVVVVVEKKHSNHTTPTSVSRR